MDLPCRWFVLLHRRFVQMDRGIGPEHLALRKISRPTLDAHKIKGWYHLPFWHWLDRGQVRRGESHGAQRWTRFSGYHTSPGQKDYRHCTDKPGFTAAIFDFKCSEALRTTNQKIRGFHPIISHQPFNEQFYENF